MSTYSKITRHPQTGQYEEATWVDDYFGQHLYGVMFKSDDKVYPERQVRDCQLAEFWAEDVMNALREWKGFTEEEILDFLTALNIVYKDRWNRDPASGEGAVENERSKS